MSEALKPPTEAGATIHDAIDALFAAKESASVSATLATTTDTATTPAVVDAAPVDGDAPSLVETTPIVDVPKVSASDYAVKLARLKRQQAAAPQPTTQRMPSPELIARAQAIEAAGGDPLKAFEAAGFDLTQVVTAYENALASNPAEYDPLAKEVRRLAEELSQYKRQAQTATEVAAEQNFLGIVAQHVSKNGDEFEYVARHGQQGLDLVKELVIESGKTGRVLPFVEALRLAESHYDEQAKIFGSTKKLQKTIQPQTQRPGIAQSAAAAGAAPTQAETRPKSVNDVINDSLAALGFT